MNDSHYQELSHDLKILVCYHKPYQLPPKNEIFLPIHVGAAISTQNLNIQRDDQLNGQPCDNISAKNESYCELTAMYWAWKNLKKLYPDVKYVGLFHYRRFFAFNESKYFDVAITKLENEITDYKIDADKVIKILEANKVILAKRATLPCSVFTHCCLYNFSDDYRTLEKVIREKFSDYYEEFVNFMHRNNKVCFGNMFVMKYDDFEKCCKWIFDVLAEVEPLVSFQYYNSYQKRVFGFMAERLLNVYVRKNNMKVKEANIYLYSNNPTQKSNMLRTFLAYCHNLVFRAEIELAFWLISPKRQFFKKLIKKIYPQK